MNGTDQILRHPLPLNVLIGEAAQLVFDIALAVKEVAVGRRLLRYKDNAMLEILDVKVSETFGLAFKVVQVEAEGVFIGEPWWLDVNESVGVEDDKVQFAKETGVINLEVAKTTLVLAVLATGQA